MSMLKEGIIAIRLEQIRVCSHSDFAGVALPMEHGGGLLQWSCVVGNTNRRYKQMKVKRGRGLAGLALQVDRTLAWDAAAGEGNELHSAYRDSPLLLAEGLQAAAAVPMHSSLLPDAGLLLLGRRHATAYTPSELKYAQACAQQLGELI